MEYVLTTNKLTKKYGNFKSLDELSIHIPKGSIYGLVGKNGAGKTTLIRVICGLQEPTKGSYSIYGIKNTSKAIVKSRRRMGAVVETPAIYLNMSAEENLKLQCLTVGVPTYDSVPEILKLVGLAKTGRKKAGHFSLGMKQRLGIAMALVGNPDFLVLDEPVNGLDPQGIIELRELILKLSADELENACKKGTRIEVTNTNALVRVLDANNIEYEILSDRAANIYGRINLSKLVIALAKENCEVISSHEQDESLENYFINLVGGKHND